MIDLDKLHDNLKNPITALNFTYVPLYKWMNLKIGWLPESWVNKGFTIKYSIEPDTQNKTQNDKWYIVRPRFEFVLDMINDNYLAKVSDAISAVKAARNNVDDYIAQLQLYSDWKSFFTENYDKYLIIAFDNCYIKIREE